MPELEAKGLSKVIDEYMPEKGDWLSDKELAVFETYKQEIARLNADCEMKGGYTPAAAEYFDKWSNEQPEKAKELWDRSR